jgi:hypothetical protein
MQASLAGESTVEHSSTRQYPYCSAACALAHFNSFAAQLHAAAAVFTPYMLVGTLIVELADAQMHYDKALQ